MSGFVTSVKDGVRIIRFNNTKRKNAISFYAYKELAKLFSEDAVNDEILVTIITGTGEYFSSGNDMKAVMEAMEKVTDIADMKELSENFKFLVDSLISYPKLIIAVVNGPAVGLGFTILTLCDIVYASERATFQAPFVKLGLCAEACSSYMFPRIMGRSKASEVLLLGHKLTAQEAYDCGLVSRVFRHNELEDLLLKLHEYGKLNVKYVRVSKQLILNGIKEQLKDSHNREYEFLKNIGSSEDFFNGMVQFLTKKSKL